jgi:NADH-quinone oxidoreductase subunit G
VTQTQPEQTTVTVTIDGQEIAAKPGELLIKVAQENGVYIPRFCWHERMKPVGMCRMCLVEVEGVRGFPPACTTTVTDGMVCRTRTDAVKKIQDGVLEFLLINHPLDCPVCDRGGECPLQDQTLAFGPGESRFIEEKRHFEKPIRLSELVLLDRERCIQCGRCTRFADEIAGDALIDFVDRGDRMQVLNFEEQPFDSYFSGNTVQICPVGALTAAQYRFKARPWDLSTAETSCTTCAVHCRGAVQSSSNRIVRLLGVDSEPVNHGWLCDKGRYGIEWVHSEHRVVEPHVRVDGELTQVSWPEALDAAAKSITSALELHGPESIAVLGGAHGTNEDAYLWSWLAKAVVRTDNVDAQMGDGLPAEAVLGLPRAEIADCETAATIVLLGPDIQEELPVLYLRLRRAAVQRGVPLVDLAPVDHALSEHASATVRTAPGEPVAKAALDAVRRAAEGRDGPIVVVFGRPSLAEAADAVVRSAAALADLPNVRFLSALRRANVHGALDAGLCPGFLPGRVTLDGGRRWFEDAWGAVPSTRGMDAGAALAAAAQGRIRVLVLLGADPIADFPDATLARRAIDAVDTIIAVDAFRSASTERADVFLPCTLWGEKTGSVTNIEGRVQRVGRKVAPEGTAMDDWRIAVELAARLGDDIDLATVDEVADEMARVAPSHMGATAALLRRARDGVVVPLREHIEEVVLRTRELTILAEDGQGASWDPIKVEGTVPADSTNAVEASGAGFEPIAPGAGGLGSDATAAAHAVEAAHAGIATAELAPSLYTWDRALPTAETPARDAYALRLVVGHTLYDGGRIVSETPALVRVRQTPRLHVNPHDAGQLGVESGTQVRVTSARGSQVVVIHHDSGVPVGVARYDFTADGAGVATLIDATQLVTDLRVETLQ